MTTETKPAAQDVATREELYDRVWATPINHLAAEYGVSGSYLVRVCAALNVPRPPVGHWQKKAVGKDRPRPPLPEALPGEQVVWSRDKPLAPPKPRPTVTSQSRSQADRPKVPASHPILRGAESQFRRTRKIDDHEFLRPYKLLLPDIVTSEACLARALDLANSFYCAFERKGHRVMFAPQDNRMRRVAVEERETPGKDRKYGPYSNGTIWSPYRPTIFYIGTVPIGLALTEMTERITLRHIKGKYLREDSDAVRSAKAWQLANSWTSERDVPSGRFRLVAYSPHRGVEWQMSWQETRKRTLASMISEVVQELEQVVEDLARKAIVADEAEAQRQREWKEQRERWRRDEDERQIGIATDASQKQLSQIIHQWSAAMSVEQFFREAEDRIARADPDRRERLAARLALARSMVGTLDPLDFLEGWIAPTERYQTRYPVD